MLLFPFTFSTFAEPLFSVFFSLAAEPGDQGRNAGAQLNLSPSTAADPTPASAAYDFVVLPHRTNFYDVTGNTPQTAAYDAPTKSSQTNVYQPLNMALSQATRSDGSGVRSTCGEYQPIVGTPQRNPYAKPMSQGMQTTSRT